MAWADPPTRGRHAAQRPGPSSRKDATSASMRLSSRQKLTRSPIRWPTILGYMLLISTVWCVFFRDCVYGPGSRSARGDVVTTQLQDGYERGRGRGRGNGRRARHSQQERQCRCGCWHRPGVLSTKDEWDKVSDVM